MRSCSSSCAAVSASWVTSARLRPRCGTSILTGAPRRCVSQSRMRSGSSTGPVQWMAVVADHLSLAHVGNLDEHVVAPARIRDQVLVIAAVHEYLLAVGDALDGLQLIAISRRILEIETVCRVAHAALELTHEHVGATLHEERYLVDARLVVLGADALLTWSWTPLDVEVEAHLSLLEDLVGTGTKR